ncbi:MarR family winged helix-turn-helix transcriptional regulator [Amphritea sp.]|uniref:MarR family winged helix-turn-helix transcriptional regulator n=1 Tax=Amphritea sp. TaxID=1872502 RepID=UPI003D12746E
MNDDLLKLDKQICHRFYTVANAFARAYRPLLSELDITYPQYVVMMALWESDNVTIYELLQKTRIDGGAMSLILKKLSGKKLLSVASDENDKRVRRVVLTPAGKAAKTKALAIPQKMRCNFDNISNEEALELMRLVDKVSNGLNQALCEIRKEH